MDFGKAIEALKQDKLVAREGWNGKGMFLYLAVVTAVQTIEGVPCGISNVRPCIVMKDAQGMCVPGWLASQTDMLAEDWIAWDKKPAGSSA